MVSPTPSPGICQFTFHWIKDGPQEDTVLQADVDEQSALSSDCWLVNDTYG